MQIDLTELEGNLPADTLRTILQRARKQVEEDAKQYRRALHATDFTQAAQLIHRMRGLALFLGITETELAPVQLLENELAAYPFPNHAMPINVIAFGTRFDVFREAFQNALLSVTGEAI